MARALPSRFLSSRRRFLETAGAATLALASPPALADAMVRLPLPGGPDERPITTAFPEKGALILQRTRPPLLETPFDVFDHEGIDWGSGRLEFESQLLLDRREEVRRSSGLPAEQDEPRFELRDQLFPRQDVSLRQDHLAQRMSFWELPNDEVFEGANGDEPDTRTDQGHCPPSVVGFRTPFASTVVGFCTLGGSRGCKTPSPRHTDHSARATPRA